MYAPSAVSLELLEAQSAALQRAGHDTVLRVPQAPSSSPASPSLLDSLNPFPTTINPMVFLQPSVQGSSGVHESQIPFAIFHNQATLWPWTTEISPPSQDTPIRFADDAYSERNAQCISQPLYVPPRSVISEAPPCSTTQQAPNQFSTSFQDLGSERWWPSTCVFPVPGINPWGFNPEDNFKDVEIHDPIPQDLAYQQVGVLVDGDESKRAPFSGRTKRRKESAALALALVRRMRNTVRHGGEQRDDPGLGIDDILDIYREGRTGFRKPKNQRTPLPVPIPNLNKKSRGREVPSAYELSSSNQFQESDSAERDSVCRADVPYKSVCSSRRNPAPWRNPPSNCSTSVHRRAFVCIVAGCGKCFVRGEHLRRHVRSMHTNDKPHRCPYEGCDKRFSRRDNLGQHVRIHIVV